jgi:hypothetical protein
MPTDPFHTAALGVTNGAFGRLVELGRAAVNVAASDAPHPQPMIEVRPSNPAACPVTILAAEKQIDLLFGPQETLREIYLPGENERLHELRGCLEAVRTVLARPQGALPNAGAGRAGFPGVSELQALYTDESAARVFAYSENAIAASTLPGRGGSSHGSGRSSIAC